MERTAEWRCSFKPNNDRQLGGKTRLFNTVLEKTVNLHLRNELKEGRDIEQDCGGVVRSLNKKNK